VRWVTNHKLVAVSVVSLHFVVLYIYSEYRQNCSTAGRLVDGDDTKMKLENLAVSGSRRAQSKLSVISRVL